MSTSSGNYKPSQSISRCSSTASSGIESPGITSPSHVKFSCGCGKCSILGYITGNKDCLGATLPSIAISTLDLPFPENMTTQKEMSYSLFKECVEKETVKVHAHFSDFVTDTFKELSLCVNFDDLKKYTSKLLAIQPSLIDFRPSDFDELESYLFTNICSWFNYELILQLRRRFLNPNGKNDTVVEKYEALLQNYIKRRCFLYTEDFGPLKTHIKCSVVTCKIVSLEFQKLTDKQIKQKKLLFLQIMESIPSFVATVKQVKEGCVELVLSIPAALMKDVTLTDEKIQQLKKNGFSDVTVDEKSLFKVSAHEIDLNIFLIH